MAFHWTKMRVALPSDPAVLGIARALNLETDTVIGTLLRIWSWAGEHTIDGYLPRLKFEDVDKFAGRPGFAKAMAAEKWLKQTATGLIFPKWERHNGQGAKRRALDRDLKDRARIRPQSMRTNCGPEQRAAKSKEENTKRKSSNRSATPIPPPPPESPGHVASNAIRVAVCSMLLDFAVRRGERLGPETAAKIAQHPNADRAHVTWALERCDEARKKGQVKNAVGYVRRLIENELPPQGWLEKFNRKQLALAAAKDVASKLPKSHSAAPLRLTPASESAVLVEPIAGDPAPTGTLASQPGVAIDLTPMAGADTLIRSIRRERLQTQPTGGGGVESLRA